MNAIAIHKSVIAMYSDKWSVLSSSRSVGIAVEPPGQRGILSITKRVVLSLNSASPISVILPSYTKMRDAPTPITTYVDVDDLHLHGESITDLGLEVHTPALSVERHIENAVVEELTLVLRATG